MFISESRLTKVQDVEWCSLNQTKHFQQKIGTRYCKQSIQARDVEQFAKGGVRFLQEPSSLGACFAEAVDLAECIRFQFPVTKGFNRTREFSGNAQVWNRGDTTR